MKMSNERPSRMQMRRSLFLVFASREFYSNFPFRDSDPTVAAIASTEIFANERD